tara:strand:+ start:2246 stop:3169 length:924 start_codon:yes stop_codon:yes gene_type:complete
MSGGGGSSMPSTQHTSSTVQQNTLPAYAQPYVERAFRRSEVESLQPYTPYGGQRLAYFSPDELNAQAMTRGFAGAGTPQAFTDAGDRFSNVGQSFDPIQFNNENIQARMNPFQQNVIDIQKREAQRRSEMAGDRISDAATKAGGLGGYREAIMQAERERNLGQRMDDIQARGSQQAFQAASRQLDADRRAEAQAFDLANRANLMAGEAQMGLGSATQADALSRISALEGIGAQQRAMRQAGLDIGFEDFTRQRDYPQQQLAFFNAMLQGLPMPETATRSTYERQPGLFQTLAGLGLGGLGLYRGMRQ